MAIRLSDLGEPARQKSLGHGLTVAASSQNFLFRAFVFFLFFFFAVSDLSFEVRMSRLPKRKKKARQKVARSVMISSLGSSSEKLKSCRAL